MGKQCFKCKLVKPIEEFYKHPAMADGHLNKCKECAKRDVKTRYYAKHDEIMAYEYKRLDDPHRREKQLEYGRNKRARNKMIGMSYSNEWKVKNQDKHKAHLAVQVAISSGSLQRQPCEVCGDLNVEAHHEDYSKPLDVRWLCTTHHGITRRKHGRNMLEMNPDRPGIAKIGAIGSDEEAKKESA